MTLQSLTTAERGGVPVLLVLESYPAQMETNGPALPVGSPQFRTACRRWRLPAELLAEVPRLNAVERAPSGQSVTWRSEARKRVDAAVSEHQPRTIVAAGWLARDAVCDVVGLDRRLPWLMPTPASYRRGVSVNIVAVPHYSMRGRLLNDEWWRAATAAAIHLALTTP